MERWSKKKVAPASFCLKLGGICDEFALAQDRSSTLSCLDAFTFFRARNSTSLLSWLYNLQHWLCNPGLTNLIPRTIRRLTSSSDDGASASLHPVEEVIHYLMAQVVGLEASGRSAVKLALARGADVVAVDSKSSIRPLQVDPAVASRLRVETGPHNRASLLNASQLVVSPGVSPVQPDVAAAIQAGVPTTSELSFAAEVLPKSIKIAAITGTNGKSTVTTFAGQLLRHAGVRSFVGGNLGIPLSEAALQCLAFPPDDPPFQAAVVEVSSYQLELPGKFQLKVGVILNLTPDHLERHKTTETYGAIKCRLFAHMDSSDLAVIPQCKLYLTLRVTISHEI